MYLTLNVIKNGWVYQICFFLRLYTHGSHYHRKLRIKWKKNVKILEFSFFFLHSSEPFNLISVKF